MTPASKALTIFLLAGGGSLAGWALHAFITARITAAGQEVLERLEALAAVANRDAASGWDNLDTTSIASRSYDDGRAEAYSSAVIVARTWLQPHRPQHRKARP